MSEAGALVGGTVVATVMANLGFKIAMDSAGIEVVQTAVGDRYVLEAMRADGFVLGGEQSGHIVMTDHATTGDGMLTGLHLLARMAQTGRSLGDLSAAVTKFPQVLINVRDVDLSRLADAPGVAAAVAAAEVELADRGRVLLRPSGTEPVVRVMVEASTQAQASTVAESIAAAVRAELALD
jgi:phosphoglucosamine mutase